MPCTDGGLPYYNDHPETKEKLDRATRLLCAVCKRLETNGIYVIVADVESGELDTWWRKHKKEDAEREAREAAEKAEALRLKKLREGALAKLSDEERNVLKIR